MNATFFRYVSACAPFVAFAALAEDPQPELVTAPIENVFTPIGFDDNDNVEVVLHGHFTNSCTKVGPVSARVSEENKTIYVTAQSWYEDLPFCEGQEMYNPFTQSVQVGLLKAGSYEVKVEGSPDVQARPLVVKEHTVPTLDDYLYASVTSFEVREESERQRQRYTLRGVFPKQPHGCLAIKRVDTKIVDGNVVVILPIAELKEGAECETVASREFVRTVTLPSYLSGRYLFHVRVLNGQSLNQVHDLGY